MFVVRPQYLMYDHVSPYVTVEFDQPPAHAVRDRINAQIFNNLAVPHIDWAGTQMRVYSNRPWGMTRENAARLSALLDPHFITVHAIFGTMCEQRCDEIAHPPVVQLVPVIPFPAVKTIGWQGVIRRYQVRNGYVHSMYVLRLTDDQLCDLNRVRQLCHLRLPGFSLLTGETRPAKQPPAPELFAMQ